MLILFEKKSSSMFYLLPPSDYSLITPFLTSSHLSLNILPIIHQTFGGEIWVDDLSSPSCAYIFDSRHGHFLLGSIDNNIQSLVDFLANVFQTRFLNSGRYFSLLYAREWSKILTSSDNLPISGAKLRTRQLYRFNKIKFKDWKSMVPEGFSIVPFTTEILERNLKNARFIIDELVHMWGNIDNFFSIGFGTCSIFQDSLAGFCLGEYFVTTSKIKMFGIGIETFPKYERKGVATAMTCALIELGLEKKYTIYWDCFKDNIGSVKTALKTGFILDLEYDVMFGKF